jgi:HSP20 family protein
MAEAQPSGVRPFVEVQQEVRRLFQELVHQPWGGQGLPHTSSWQPCCDMVETDDAILVDVELPGVQREDVRLAVEGDVLHIAGERRTAHLTVHAPL